MLTVEKGVLDYYGPNSVSVALWAQQDLGAHLTDFTLTAGTPVLTALKAPKLVPSPKYTARPGAY